MLLLAAAAVMFVFVWFHFELSTFSTTFDVSGRGPTNRSQYNNKYWCTTRSSHNVIMGTAVHVHIMHTRPGYLVLGTRVFHFTRR